MNYLLFLVPDEKNLKCQKVSILKGFFFLIFYKNHFKLANWLHTRTAPFSTIQLNSNMLCRVFNHSNTISKIMLAILRFYVYLIDNFPIFNSDFLSDVTNILLNCLLQFTIFHQITLFAAYFFITMHNLWMVKKMHFACYLSTLEV